MATTTIRHRHRRHQPGVRDDARTHRAFQRFSRRSQRHRRRVGLRHATSSSPARRARSSAHRRFRRARSRWRRESRESPLRRRSSIRRRPCPTATRHETSTCSVRPQTVRGCPRSSPEAPHRGPTRRRSRARWAARSVKTSRSVRAHYKSSASSTIPLRLPDSPMSSSRSTAHSRWVTARNRS